jgi:hypothetical protein
MSTATPIINVLSNPESYFDNQPPVDRFSPEYLRAQRAQEDATRAAMVATRSAPIPIFAIISNSGLPDQQGGSSTHGPGNWTDFDIAGQANAMAREVSRSDVVPFRKSAPPASPQPPRQPAVPMRPAAQVHPWKAAMQSMNRVIESQQGVDFGAQLNKLWQGGRR